VASAETGDRRAASTEILTGRLYSELLLPRWVSIIHDDLLDKSGKVGRVVAGDPRVIPEQFVGSDPDHPILAHYSGSNSSKP